MLKRLAILLCLPLFLVGPSSFGGGNGGEASQETSGPTVFVGSGSGSAVLYVLDFPVEQVISHIVWVEQLLATGVHEKAFAFLVPEAFLLQEVELFPLSPTGHHIVPTSYIYVHEVWNGPKTHAFVESHGNAVSESDEAPGFWTIIVFPSVPRGEITVAAGRHFLMVGGTGDYRYEITLTGTFAASAPVVFPGPSRQDLAEGDFTSIAAAGGRIKFVPVGSAVVQSRLDFQINQDSYVLVQVDNQTSISDFRLLRPNGEEVPLPQKWNSGTVVFTPVGGGLITQGGLYQTDLLTQDLGTWSLQIDHSVGAAIDAIVTVQPLALDDWLTSV